MEQDISLAERIHSARERAHIELNSPDGVRSQIRGLRLLKKELRILRTEVTTIIREINAQAGQASADSLSSVMFDLFGNRKLAGSLRAGRRRNIQATKRNVRDPFIRQKEEVDELILRCDQCILTGQQYLEQQQAAPAPDDPEDVQMPEESGSQESVSELVEPISVAESSPRVLAIDAAGLQRQQEDPAGTRLRDESTRGKTTTKRPTPIEWAGIICLGPPALLLLAGILLTPKGTPPLNAEQQAAHTARVRSLAQSEEQFTASCKEVVQAIDERISACQPKKPRPGTVGEFCRDVRAASSGNVDLSKVQSCTGEIRALTCAEFRSLRSTYSLPVGCNHVLGDTRKRTSTLTPTPAAANQGRASAELQKQRLKLINDMKKQGVVQKIHKANGLVKMYVLPRFFTMPFDDRSTVADLCYAYQFEIPKGGDVEYDEFLMIVSAMTNKNVGTYHPKEGLKLD